jgi:hypothetical protein
MYRYIKPQLVMQGSVVEATKTHCLLRGDPLNPVFLSICPPGSIGFQL